MAKKKTPANFTSILADVDTTQSATASPEKGPLLTYRIDADLKPLLDRVVFWRGKDRASQREVLNDALRAFFANDPNANRPMPGE
jgi:hypothetical protein